jgi:two-component system cell cycle response regulator
MAVIKLLIQAMQICKELALQYTLVGNSQIVSECKGFEDTRNWQFHDSLADAKASFTRAATPPAAQTAVA